MCQIANENVSDCKLLRKKQNQLRIYEKNSYALIKMKSKNDIIGTLYSQQST